jgi:hypothetical protein
MAAWKASKVAKEYESKGGEYENESGSKNEPKKGYALTSFEPSLDFFLNLYSFSTGTGRPNINRIRRSLRRRNLPPRNLPIPRTIARRTSKTRRRKRRMMLITKMTMRRMMVRLVKKRRTTRKRTRLPLGNERGSVWKSHLSVTATSELISLHWWQTDEPKPNAKKSDKPAAAKKWASIAVFLVATRGLIWYLGWSRSKKDDENGDEEEEAADSELEDEEEYEDEDEVDLPCSDNIHRCSGC